MHYKISDTSTVCNIPVEALEAFQIAEDSTDVTCLECNKGITKLIQTGGN